MIQSIVKAMNIIEFLGANPSREYMMTEIADNFNMDYGTCTNILKTLASKGFIQQSGPRRGYKFGYIFYSMTGAMVENDELTNLAKSDIDKLGELIGERILLSVIKNDKRILLYYTTTDHELTVNTEVEKDVYATNTGRVIIANYSPAQLEKFISRAGLPKEEDWPEIYGSDNIKESLIYHLSVIKENGYDIYENKSGIHGLAVPIFKGKVSVGSIGICMPKSRCTNEKSILKELRKTAKTIGEKI